MTSRLYAPLRRLRRRAWRRRHALAFTAWIILAANTGLDAVAASWQLAYDPQRNRSLAEGALFLIEKGAPAARGDIVAFTPPAHAAALFPEPQRVRFLKRVAGMPGDLVEVDARVTRVNGVVVGRGLALAPVLGADAGFFVRRFRIGADRFFPMGETDDSFDGRYYGEAPLSAILGRARRLL